MALDEAGQIRMWASIATTRATVEADSIIDVTNGSIFPQAGSGERFVENKAYFVPFLATIPAVAARQAGPDGPAVAEVPAVPGTPHVDELHARQPQNYTAAQVNEFVHLQYTYLTTNDEARLALGIQANAAPTEDQRKAALLLGVARCNAWGRGLISPSFTPATFHVKYNCCKPLTVAETTAMRQAMAGTSDDFGATMAVIGGPALHRFSAKMNDIICMVAYVFRTRGHHYVGSPTDPIALMYKKLTTQTMATQDEIALINLVTWQNLSTVGLHAIMPIHLDEFWRSCSEDTKAAGTVHRRFHCSAAGQARWNNLYLGLTDLKTASPVHFVQFEDLYTRLEAIITSIDSTDPATRWTGSVNAVYYGKSPTIPNAVESEYAAAAASVLSIYDQMLTPGAAPLLNSQSLKGAASGAPLTGSVFGQTAAAVLRDPELIKHQYVQQVQAYGVRQNAALQ